MDDNNLETQNTGFTSKPEQKIQPLHFLLLSIIGLAMVVFTAFYYFNLNSALDNIVVDTVVITPVEEVEKSGWNPTGHLYLSLEPLDDKSMGIYEYSFADGELRPYYVTKNGLAMTGKFKDDSSMLISEYLSDDSTQIVEINTATKERQVLTDSKPEFKRHPLWSKVYGLLMYAARPEPGEVLALPDEFSVYSVNKDGVDTELTKGTFPVLTPDGKSVVVLRNDGIHKVDILTKESENIWGYESTGGVTNQMFNVSPTGEYIAWTFPDRGELYVAKVTSWAPFKADVKFMFEKHIFWPIFSPDGKYLAFEEVDWTDPPTSPRLVVVDLSSPTLEKKTIYDLSGFDQAKMFISDWK